MVDLPSLSDVYHLFVDGFIVGGLLSAFPFLVGFAVRFLYRTFLK